MKKIMAITLCVLMILSMMAGCAGSKSGDGEGVPTIEKGKLIMSTNAAFPPYEMTTDDGGYAGIDVEIAQAIAQRARHLGGGLRYVKALGVMVEERNLAQVTMNLTDYSKSSMYSVFELVKMEARRYGVGVVGSEVTGIVPMQALLDCAEYYLQLEDFSIAQVLEYHI